jgi:histidine triad (HIT) family protein
MAECLFCQIAAGNVAATKRFENDQIIAFDDIHPKSPIHILVVPKKHLSSLAEATPEDDILLGQILLTVQRLAKENGLSGYKTVINTGQSGGQVIGHLHAHLLGGKNFSE